MKYKKKKRPLGITILGVLFILPPLLSIKFIENPKLYMGILLEGNPVIIFNIIELTVIFATGIGFLKLIPLMRKVFLVHTALSLTSMLLVDIFYSRKEQYAIYGDGTAEYTPSAIMDFSFILIGWALMVMLFIYVYKKRDAFEGSLLSGPIALLGEKVKLTVNVPSDFIKKTGFKTFHGKISDAEENRLVVILKDPIKYSNTLYTTAVCVARYEDVSTISLKKKKYIPFNITFLPLQTYKFADISKDNYSRGLATDSKLKLVW